MDYVNTTSVPSEGPSPCYIYKVFSSLRENNVNIWVEDRVQDRVSSTSYVHSLSFFLSLSSFFPYTSLPLLSIIDSTFVYSYSMWVYPLYPTSTVNLGTTRQHIQHVMCRDSRGICKYICLDLNTSYFERVDMYRQDHCPVVSLVKSDSGVVHVSNLHLFFFLFVTY